MVLVLFLVLVYFWMLITFFNVYATLLHTMVNDGLLVAIVMVWDLSVLLSRFSLDL